MQVDNFQNWKRELDIIERQMNDLLRAGPSASIADRQVRRIQFAALIERREAAARALLQSSRPTQTAKASRGSSDQRST
jgi:hypothetical protein